MKVVKRLLTKVDKLVIAIGSAEFKNTERNPFDGDERSRMVKAYLREAGLRGVRVVAIPDGKTYSSAIRNLLREVPKIDVLFLSTEKLALSKFLKGKVKLIKFRRTGNISSTRIRDTIAYSGKWEPLTGKSVVRLIKKLNGVERIKRAYGIRNYG
jgi:nicotinamide-nucleotide adenylyltransferase